MDSNHLHPNYAQRPHPHLSIPPGAQPPTNPSPIRSWSPYAFELSPPPGQGQPAALANPWDESESPSTPLANGRVSRAQSAYVPEAASMAFPEPQLYRSSSQRPTLSHRPSKSDAGPSAHLHRNTSTSSTASSVSSYFPNDTTEEDSYSDLSRELSHLSLDSEEGLRRFQSGELNENDEEWHRLVPEAARESLGKQEVQRQSVLFEVFKSERDYTRDLGLVDEVFIKPLRNAQPPVIPLQRLRGFIAEVFCNMDQIRAHHERMLAQLFARQREQHPIVQSVADIILDSSLLFLNEYEIYIKHYPLAEARHRSELRRNRRYQAFIQQCSQDPRIRKRDLITFLSRPVTRLPRLSLVLEHLGKLTDPEHDDVETLPLIMSILSDFIKSTQPGIQAAESKVKFWNLCESLVYQKGEIIDMDLYDDSRTLVYSGPLARRQRSEVDWHGWSDLFVALLDNHLLLTREEQRPHGMVKRLVSSRPIPLQYLRLGGFTGLPETRREKADDGRLLESLRYHSKTLYPFTVYHAANKSTRRYTLHAVSEAVRKKWKDALVDAIGVHKARQDANMWFVPQTLNDGYFRTPGPRVGYNSGVHFNGKVTCATPFISGGRRYIAVGCASGIFVSPRGDSSFRKVLNYSNPTSMAALHEFNKFIVHFDTYLVSYSLDILARVAQGLSAAKNLDASLEKIAGQDGNVLFFRPSMIGKRTIIMYAAKNFLQITLQALEAVHPSDSHLTTRRHSEGLLSFRSFGDPFYVPKDAYDITPLVKTVAISTEKGIVIVDPTNLASSKVNVVPNFSDTLNNAPMADLKGRCDTAKPLGLVRCDASELLVVYNTMGCYITKHGEPSRSCGYVRWEAQATSYAHRGNNILLFSSEFIEIRNVNTGRLLQVIEAPDIRLLHCGPKEGTSDTILAAMRGDKSGNEGISDKIVELVETAEIGTPADTEGLWDEWDM